MTPALTPQMLRAARVIQDSLDRLGVAPTVKEMRETLGIASNNRVVGLFRSLEERGVIRRIPFRARAIEMLRRVPGDGAYGGLAQLRRAWEGATAAEREAFLEEVAEPMVLE